MKHLRLFIIFSLLLKINSTVIGNPIDLVIDEIFDKFNKKEIVDTFKTDQELLFSLLNNTKPLYEKLIEKPDAESKIARIFSILCALTIPDFNTLFPTGKMFYLTKDQIWDYWVKIMKQVIAYHCELSHPSHDSFTEESPSTSELNSEDFEEDYFEKTNFY